MFQPLPVAVATLMPEGATAIVEALNLDAAPVDMDPETALMVGGLDLDSIDALKNALVSSEQYGFSIRSDDQDKNVSFAPLKALTTHIAGHRIT